MPTEQLINELQSFGVRLVDPKAGGDSRRGGAGPSDHKAMTIDGVTVMAPVHTAPAFESPYHRRASPMRWAAARSAATALLIGEVRFQPGRASTNARRPTAFPIRKLRRCTAATCWRRRSCKPASDIRAAPRPASSARSASRWRPAGPLSARRRSNSAKSPAPPSSSMASPIW